MKRLVTILTLCLFVNTYGQNMQDNKKMAKDAKTIVEVASTNDNFKTLTKAVTAADLVGTLNSDGPFTVFAPNDAAFNKVPKNQLEGLLAPSAKADLQAVLTYHVIAGKIMAADLIKAINDNGGSYNAKTVQGGELSFALDGNSVVITDANGGTSKVIATDVQTSNGVIHAIDTVVLPSMNKL